MWTAPVFYPVLSWQTRCVLVNLLHDVLYPNYLLSNRAYIFYMIDFIMTP